MKPNKVSTVAFVQDEESSSSSFLLQGALHFAEQGSAVCVVSTKEVKSLPPSLHGVVMPGADVFGLIRFLYLPSWQDLLQHLYSIHLHTHVPSVIILESIEHYFVPESDQTDENETVKFNLQHASLICASLIDAGAVCAKRLKKRVWYVKTEHAHDNVSAGTVVLTSPNTAQTLRFTQSEDTSLILREIINVIVPK